MTPRTFTFGFVALILGIVMALIGPQSSSLVGETTSAVPSADGMRLQPPLFLSAAKAETLRQDLPSPDFLAQEAGIAAYTNVGKPIELSKVEGFFRTKEQETSDFIVGAVTPPGYEDLPDLREGADVHVYVHKDGWIIAYLLEWQHTAQIIDWLGYDQNPLSTSTLERTIRTLMTAANVANAAIRYYDFRYPDATTLMLVADVERVGGGSDSFEVKVPVSFQLFDVTWSAANYEAGSRCEINGVEVSRIDYNGWRMAHGSLRSVDFPQGQVNETTINRLNWDGPAYCGLAITYREAQ